MVRDQPAGIDECRRAYADATGDRTRVPAFASGDSPTLADELVG